MTILLANIMGPDMLILVAVIALLFGGSQLPKLARGMGEAKSEFEKAQTPQTGALTPSSEHSKTA